MKQVVDIRMIVYIIIILTLCQVNSYASYSSDNYTLTTASIATSGGQALSPDYTISNSGIGYPFGGTSKSSHFSLRAGYILEPTVVSLSISPGTWLLGTVSVTSSTINRYEKIIISNDGNTKFTCSLQAIDSTGGGAAASWTAKDTPGINEYTASALITEVGFEAISDSYFNDKDILTESPQQATETKFAITDAEKNGVDIKPNERRAIWLKFDAPKADITRDLHKEHNISVFITTEN